MDYEKILDDFIREERKKSQMGSGDDLFYELQIENYINKQRPFWISFMKFIESEINSETSHNSRKNQSAMEIKVIPVKLPAERMKKAMLKVGIKQEDFKAD